MIHEGEVVVVTRDGAEISTFAGEPVEREITRIAWDVRAAEKGGFNTSCSRRSTSSPRPCGTRSPDASATTAIDLSDASCRTSSCAKSKRHDVRVRFGLLRGMYGMYLHPRLARLPVELELASEFRYRDPLVEEGTLASRSPKAARPQTLWKPSSRQGGRRQCSASAIVSARALSRDADATFYTHAGPEIGVAASKTFTAQCAAMALFALSPRRRPTARWIRRELREIVTALRDVPASSHQALDSDEDILRSRVATRSEDRPLLRPARQLSDRARGRPQAQGDLATSTLRATRPAR